ncbi:MAG: aminoglycoside phosphotransferase family protein [Chloroflexota bacterium]|nr:aminoglycoside phosphotransferase family protein [Chloroflexota bacterium]
MRAPPVLTPPELARYLLRHDLIQPQQVVAGDLVVADATRRHANTRVISAGGPSYLVKQGVGAARAASIAHEAVVYQVLQESGAGRVLGRYLPRCYAYHAAEALLVLELVPDAHAWGAYHQRWGRFSGALAAVLGTALGTLHQTPQPAGRPLPQRPPPAILSIQRPTLALYQEISHANLQLIQTLQRFPPFGQHLDLLRHAWQPNALVHYDLKGDNLLAVVASIDFARAIKVTFRSYSLSRLGYTLTSIEEWSTPRCGTLPARRCGTGGNCAHRSAPRGAPLLIKQNFRSPVRQ